MKALIFFAVFFLLVSLGYAEGERRVQLVNATSVPWISLAVDGREDYANFPQGLYTGDAPVAGEAVRLGMKEKSEGLCVERVVRYEESGVQTVVLLGDFRDRDAEQNQNQRDAMEGKEGKNVFAKVYSSCIGGGKSVRYRWVNGMSDRSLRVSGKRQDEVEILPFETHVSWGQEASAAFSARVGEKEWKVSIAQRGEPRNAVIVFYLREGKPAFLRVFEPHCDCRDCVGRVCQNEQE